MSNVYEILSYMVTIFFLCFFLECWNPAKIHLWLTLTLRSSSKICIRPLSDTFQVLGGSFQTQLHILVYLLLDSMLLQLLNLFKMLKGSLMRMTIATLNAFQTSRWSYELIYSVRRFFIEIHRLPEFTILKFILWSSGRQFINLSFSSVERNISEASFVYLLAWVIY